MNSERRWPQQGIFAVRVKEYCKRNGLLTARGAVKTSELSDLFNVHEDTLRQMLYASTRKRPNINTLSHIAWVIGCFVTEFIDSPGNPTPGMSQERWAELTAHERALATKLFHTIGSEELSAAEKELLCRNFHALEKSLLKLKKA
jgi:hypothetical protein